MPGFIGDDVQRLRRRRLLGRQHHGRPQRTILALGHTPFDDQRATDAADQMLAHRLVAHELLARIGHEAGIIGDRNFDLLRPVAGVEAHRINHPLQCDCSVAGVAGQNAVVGQGQRAAAHHIAGLGIGDAVDLVQRACAVDREQCAHREAVVGPAGTAAGEGVGGRPVGGQVDIDDLGVTQRPQQQPVVGAAYGAGTGEDRLSIAVEVDKNRRARITDQAQRVVVARAALHHPRAAFGFGDQHPRRIVVEHSHVECRVLRAGVDRISGDKAVLDRDDAGVLAQRIVNRLDGQRAPGVVARAESQAGDLGVGLIKDLDLAQHAEVQVDRDQLRRVGGQFEAVGVDDLAGGTAFEHARRVAALQHQQRSQVVVEHPHFDVSNRNAVECLLVGHAGAHSGAHDLQAVADHDLALALAGVVVRGPDQHGLRRAPVAGVEDQHAGPLPGDAAVDGHPHRVGLGASRWGGLASVVGRRDACGHGQVRHGAGGNAAHWRHQRDRVGIGRA